MKQISVDPANGQGSEHSRQRLGNAEQACESEQSKRGHKEAGLGSAVASLENDKVPTGHPLPREGDLALYSSCMEIASPCPKRQCSRVLLNHDELSCCA